MPTVIFLAFTLCGICLLIAICQHLLMDVIIALPVLPLTGSDIAFVRCASWILLQPVNAASCAYLIVPPCTAHTLTTSSNVYAISVLAGCMLAGEPRVCICTPAC